MCIMWIYVFAYIAKILEEKMNNKIFSKKGMGLLLAAAVVIPTSLIATTSCGLDKPQDTKYVLAFDGPDRNKNDGGFNQAAYEGIRDYMKTDMSDKERKAEGSEPFIVKPATTNVAGFLQMYLNVKEGSYIICPGPSQVNAIGQGNEEVKNKKFIVLDGPVEGKDNIAAVNYKTEQASYVAGIATALYAATNKGFKNLDKTGDGKVTISGYGGYNIWQIRAYLTGFYAGVQDGIRAAKQLTAKYPHAKDVSFFREDMTNGNTAQSWNSGGAVGVLGRMANANVDVVMMVAGSQTEDIIQVPNFKGMIIPVDMDATVTHPSIKGRILFSALKNLGLSIRSMLKYVATGGGAGKVWGKNGYTTEGKVTIDNAGTPLEVTGLRGFGSTTQGTPANGLVGITDGTHNGYGQANKDIYAIYAGLASNPAVAKIYERFKPGVDLSVHGAQWDWTDAGVGTDVGDSLIPKDYKGYDLVKLGIVTGGAR